jgi:hypothetical protein
MNKGRVGSDSPGTQRNCESMSQRRFVRDDSSSNIGSCPSAKPKNQLSTPDFGWRKLNEIALWGSQRSLEQIWLGLRTALMRSSPKSEH